MNLKNKTLGLNIGIPTIISIIIAYFIYQYSKQQGWTLLAFISKAYLLFYLIIGAIIIAIVLLILLVIFIMFLFYKKSKDKKKDKKDKNKKIIDAEYKIIK